MTYEPTPKEVLFLWRLIFLNEQPKQSETKPGLDPKERGRLVEAGLIEREKRGRAFHLVPTDLAWSWASEHLDAPLPERSTVSAEPLRAVLTYVKAFLTANDAALADLVRARRLAPESPKLGEEPASNEGISSQNHGLQQRIRAIYQEQTGRSSAERLRLSRLRERLADVPRAQLDDALLEMQRTGAAVLYPIDDPGDISADDQRAAFSLLGNPRHVLYLEARP